MAEPARANMMAVRRFKTRNATRGQSDFLPSRRSRVRTVFWAEETHQSESFPRQISRDDRLLTAEWVSLRKDDAPALLP